MTDEVETPWGDTKGVGVEEAPAHDDDVSPIGGPPQPDPDPSEDLPVEGEDE